MSPSPTDSAKKAPINRKYPLTLAARPRSYYVELAEIGSLMDFLQNFMNNDFHQDEVFRQEMFHILLDHSNTIPPELEEELLMELQNSLTYFLDKVHECNSTTHSVKR